MHIMLDLETLSLRPNAAILSIGAVKFSRDEGVVDEFYRTILLESSMESGGAVDADTIRWWMKQEDNSRKEVAMGCTPIRAALGAFSSWYRNNPQEYPIWGNGAPFDNVILREAYIREGAEAPWDFRKDRCYRTVAAENPGIIVIPRGTHHISLDDARNQANHLIKIWRSQLPI